LIADHGMAVMFTAGHFIAAAVLQADGLADSLGQESGVESHRVGAVSAVAAGAFNLYDLDVARRNAQQRGQVSSHVIDALSRGPGFDVSIIAGAAADVHNSAGTAKRAMHLVGVKVLGTERLGRRCDDLVDVSSIDGERIS